jgi:Ca-activated chloride channel homolog
MKRSLFHLIVCLAPLFAGAQPFFTGRITDDIDRPLAGVTIKLPRTGKHYQTDTAGYFKIPTSRKSDTLICTLSGYDSLKTVVQSGNQAVWQLWPILVPQRQPGPYLSSLTRNLVKDPGFIRQLFSAETYKTLVENGFVDASRFPATGFMLHVNTASYSNVRRFINSGTQMPVAAVRIEEMLNYFPLSYAPPPMGNQLFGINTWLSTCPWDVGSQLLLLNVQARKLDLEKVPPGNLVFLIDNSGSMDTPNRLPLLQSAFKMLVANLRPADTVTIVTYGDRVGVWLPPTGGAEKQKLVEAIESIEPGGTTPGASGIRLAYQMAEKTFKPAANNRIILATDGDFNVGIKDEKELENFITRYRNSGIFLTCLGVGMGNYKDSKLETLARYGKGNFAYLDNEQEAQKVLVKEFTQTAITVASDVLMNVDFQPATVASYRLIGFDNSQAALADTSAFLQGGDVGGGHSLMALFELKLKANAPLAKPDSGAKIATVRLQYRRPGKRSTEYQLQSIPFNIIPFQNLDTTLRFATSVAMLGQVLRQSSIAKKYSLDDVAAIATQAASPTDAVQQEFLKLVEAAKKIYGGVSNGKKKRK